MKAMQRVISEHLLSLVVDHAEVLGRHDAKCNEYQPNERADEYGALFRESYTEIERERRDRFVADYTVAFEDTRRNIEGLGKFYVCRQIERLALGEAYHSYLDDSTYVVRTADGFAVCDNGEEVVCATADAAARIVVENAR